MQTRWVMQRYHELWQTAAAHRVRGGRHKGATCMDIADHWHRAVGVVNGARTVGGPNSWRWLGGEQNAARRDLSVKSLSDLHELPI